MNNSLFYPITGTATVLKIRQLFLDINGACDTNFKDFSVGCTVIAFITSDKIPLPLLGNLVPPNLLDPSDISFCKGSLVTMFTGKKPFLNELNKLIYSVIKMFIKLIDSPARHMVFITLITK